MTPDPDRTTAAPPADRTLRKALAAALNGFMVTSEEAWGILDHWDALDALVAERDRLREALEAIATGNRPTDSPTWHSGKSWRIELARAALAVASPRTDPPPPPPPQEQP